MHWIVDLDDTLVNTTRDMRGAPDRVDRLTFVDGALAFLNAYASRITILSVGDAMLQMRKLEAVGLKNLVRRVVIVPTDDLKVAMLEALVDDLRTGSGGEIIVLGDRIDLEIRAAKRLGCRTVRMRLPDGKYRDHEPASPEEEPDHTVSDFFALLDTLHAAHPS